MKSRPSLVIFIKLLSILLLLFFVEDQKIFSRLTHLFSSQGIMGGLAFLVIWISSILALLVTSFSSQYYIRLFFSILIFCTTILGSSFFFISNGTLGYDNLYILFQNFNYTRDALIQYPYEILKALLYASLAFTFFIKPSEILVNKHRFLRYFLNIIPFVPIVLLFIITLLRGGYGTAGTPMQYRITALSSLMAVENLAQSDNVRQRSSYKAQPDSVPVDIVLIMDESIRADFYDINNENINLTNYLQSQKKRIYNFGFASSGANCSAESNQIIRYTVSGDKLEESFNTHPYMWEFARNAGYKTVMIEGQANKGSLNDRMTQNELLYIDEFIYSEGKNDFERDLDIARTIKKLTSAKHAKPLFIYAVKKGLHFPYSEKVPENKKIFKSNSLGNESGSRNDLINSYKNGIAYVTDPFFKILLEKNVYDNSILFYTSDHGQNLMDNGTKQSHCSTSNTSPYEGLVPLFIITDHKNYKTKFEQAVLLNADRASHFNIMPTILDIFGYSQSDIEKNFGKTLFDEITEPRKFITGLLKENNIGFGERNAHTWVTLPDSMKRKTNHR